MRSTSKRHSRRSPKVSDTAEALSRAMAERLTVWFDSITFEFPVTQEKSRNSPGLFSKLPRGGWLCRLPQLDRISLRVVQADEPAVGIRLRINLGRDSSGSWLGCHFVEIPDSNVQHPDLVGSLEKVARLRLRIENGGSGLLLLNGILGSSMASARSPSVAGTNAPALSDLWLGRRILRFRSLFPFPFLQPSHREHRPPQGEERALAVRLSAPLYQVGSAPR